MWKIFFGCLCIFIKIGNLSAQNLNFFCCDIYEIVFMQKCISSHVTESLKDNNALQIEKNSVNFQCNGALIEGIVYGFVGSLRPSNPYDFKECIQELNSTYRSTVTGSVFQNHIKNKHAVCKPHVYVLGIATTNSTTLSQLNTIGQLAPNIEVLRWSMFSKSFQVNQFIGQFEKLQNFTLFTKTEDLIGIEDITYNNVTQLARFDLYLDFNTDTVKNFTLPALLRDMKSLQRFWMKCNKK